MEFLDIVDESGMPTGERVARTKAHAEGICHRTAHIWVIQRVDGRVQVLLQKRSMQKDSFPGCLDTSSAGHIQAGDEPRESALRELAEELGIEASPEDLQFIGNCRIQYEKEFHGKLFRDNEVVFLYIYDRPVKLEDIHVQAEELESVGWYDLEETIERIHAHDSRYCVPRQGIETVRKYLESRIKAK